MKISLRWIITLFGNLLVLLIVQMINSSLASYSIFLYLNALFIVYLAITTLSFTSGLLSVMILGLIVDSYEVIPWGTSMVYFGIGYTAVYWFKCRFESHSAHHLMVFTQVLNAVLYLTLSIQFAQGQLHHLSYWVSVISNLVLSQVVLAVATPWFISFQRSILEVTGYEVGYKKKRAS